jgi:hypothetical protein
MLSVTAVELSRLRLVSSKLAIPVNIDGVTPETTGAELMALASAQIKRDAIWFCVQTADDPDACENAGTMPIKKGEQLTPQDGGKSLLKMRRVWFTLKLRPAKLEAACTACSSSLQHRSNCPKRPCVTVPISLIRLT